MINQDSGMAGETTTAARGPTVYPIYVPVYRQSYGFGKFFNSDIQFRPRSQCTWNTHEVDASACEPGADDGAPLVKRVENEAECIDIHVNSQGGSGSRYGPKETGMGTAESPYVNLNTVTSGCIFRVYFRHCCKFPMIRVIVTGVIDYKVDLSDYVTFQEDRLLIDFAGATIDTSQPLPATSNYYDCNVRFACGGDWGDSHVIMRNMKFDAYRHDDEAIFCDAKNVVLNDCEIVCKAADGPSTYGGILATHPGFRCADGVKFICDDIDLSTESEYSLTLGAESALDCEVDISCVLPANPQLEYVRNVIGFQATYAENCTARLTGLWGGNVRAFGFLATGAYKDCVAKVSANNYALGWTTRLPEDSSFSNDYATDSSPVARACQFEGGLAAAPVGMTQAILSGFVGVRAYSCTSGVPAMTVPADVEMQASGYWRCLVHESSASFPSVEFLAEPDGYYEKRRSVVLFLACGDIIKCTGYASVVNGAAYGAERALSGSVIQETSISVTGASVHGASAYLIKDSTISASCNHAEGNAGGASVGAAMEGCEVTVKSKGIGGLSGVFGGEYVQDSQIFVTDENHFRGRKYSATGLYCSMAIRTSVNITANNRKTTVFEGRHMVDSSFSGSLSLDLDECDIDMVIIGCYQPETCINSSVSVSATPQWSYRYRYNQEPNDHRCLHIVVSDPLMYSYAVGCVINPDRPAPVPIPGLTCSSYKHKYTGSHGRTIVTLAPGWISYPYPDDCHDIRWYGCTDGGLHFYKET